MRHSKYTLFALVVLLAAGATDLVAQQRSVVVQARRGWLGFSYEPTFIRVDGDRRSAIVVVEVMEDSPAEQAGLLVGDTIWAINDLRVTEPFMESLGSTLQNGDAVRVRVRSRNRDRTLSMTAVNRPSNLAQLERPRPGYVEVRPDDVRERVRILLDSARIMMDTTLVLPRFHFEQLPGGGTVYMWGDSTLRLRSFNFDSTFGGRGGVWVFSDTMAFPDSMFAGRLLPGVRVRGGRGGLLRVDSAMRMQMDTVRAALRGMPRGRIYGLSRDSLFTFEPGEARAFSGFSIFGMRAVGGAELTDLNPELADYFGADDGVLVLRVPNNTPAERAGLAAGDVITGVNGRTVESMQDLNRAIAESGRGSIRLEILRRNQRRTIELRDD